jgi:hypothetical protein
VTRQKFSQEQQRKAHQHALELSHELYHDIIWVNAIKNQRRENQRDFWKEKATSKEVKRVGGRDEHMDVEY